MIQIEIYGKPVPWAAPRKGGNHFYSPRHEDKKFAQWQIKSQYREEIFGGPVYLDFLFLLPIPKGTSSIKRKQMLAGLIHHMKKPDVSNLTKFYEDCLKGIIISDDNQVVGASHWKQYSENPGVLIRIFNLNHERPMPKVCNENFT